MTVTTKRPKDNIRPSSSYQIIELQIRQSYIELLHWIHHWNIL